MASWQGRHEGCQGDFGVLAGNGPRTSMSVPPCLLQSADKWVLRAEGQPHGLKEQAEARLQVVHGFIEVFLDPARRQPLFEEPDLRQVPTSVPAPGAALVSLCSALSTLLTCGFLCACFRATPPGPAAARPPAVRARRRGGCHGGARRAAPTHLCSRGHGCRRGRVPAASHPVAVEQSTPLSIALFHTVLLTLSASAPCRPYSPTDPSIRRAASRVGCAACVQRGSDALGIGFEPEVEEHGLVETVLLDASARCVHQPLLSPARREGRWWVRGEG